VTIATFPARLTPEMTSAAVVFGPNPVFSGFWLVLKLGSINVSLVCL